jgi:hypothetical protein
MLAKRRQHHRSGDQPGIYSCILRLLALLVCHNPAVEGIDLCERWCAGPVTILNQPRRNALPYDALRFLAASLAWRESAW